MNRPTRLLFLAAAALAAACATQKPATQTSSTPQKPAAASAPATDVTQASLRTNAGLGTFELRDDLKNAPFDFNSARPTQEALAILKANADVIKTNPGIAVLVAGNGDERGTVSYNLTLGLRRAKAVRRYYIKFGADGKRIATISYGKGKPLCADSSEECWARNRRAETRARPKAGLAAVLTPRQ